jgi:hypothetical protein
MFFARSRGFFKVWISLDDLVLFLPCAELTVDFIFHSPPKSAPTMATTRKKKQFKHLKKQPTPKVHAREPKLMTKA